MPVFIGKIKGIITYNPPLPRQNDPYIISYHIKFSFVGLKPFAVGRSTMDGYVPVVHRCSFMCTIHIDMTAQTPALTSRGALRPLECSCHIVVEEHNYTLKFLTKL